MIYVFDTSSIRTFSSYFPSRFPGFWELLERDVDRGRILSVREVYHELEYQSTKPFVDAWAKANKHIFLKPTQEELAFVAQIFGVEHFQQLIGDHQMSLGHHVADPFLVASAHIRTGCVVTEEQAKPNATKIPNVCSHFGVDCTDLEGFMDREGWSFDAA